MSFTPHLYQIWIQIHTYIIWNIVFIIATLLLRQISGHIIHIFQSFLPYFLFFFFINSYLTIAFPLTFSPPFHFSTTLNLNVIYPQPHTINLIVSLALYTYFSYTKKFITLFLFFFSSFFFGGFFFFISLL